MLKSSLQIVKVMPLTQICLFFHYEEARMMPEAKLCVPGFPQLGLSLQGTETDNSEVKTFRINLSTSLRAPTVMCVA